MATILCVVDDPTVASSLDQTIGGMGHTVVRAACVHEALGVARERPVELVLAECVLPDLSGLELLTILRDQGRDVAFIMLADAEATDEAAAAIARGADDCLTKPMRSAQIEVAVRNALERSALRRQNEVLRGEVADLREGTRLASRESGGSAPPPVFGPAAVVLPSLDIVEAERILIATALERANGNKTRAAVLLNMSLRTLRHKLNAGQLLATAS